MRICAAASKDRGAIRKLIEAFPRDLCMIIFLR
jgi:hypothetical protein